MIPFDCHVHSIASGHAFGTLEEIAGYCRQRGLEGFALTDHGPALPGASCVLHFQALRMIPRNLDGVQILRGAEANITDYEGNLDLDVKLLKRLDLVIASFHDVVIKHSTFDDHTRALIAVAQNPLVDILGHTGRGPYRYDIPAVLSVCKDTGTLIEINRQTFRDKPEHDVCLQIALACRDMGVPVVVNSDAHLASAVGRVDEAMRMLESIDFPENLIMNRSADRIKAHLKGRKPWLKFD
jgi:putative hydrolase